MPDFDVSRVVKAPHTGLSRRRKSASILVTQYLSSPHDKTPRKGSRSRCGNCRPPDSQDRIALAMLNLSGNEVEAEEVDPAHLAGVLEGLAQAKRRQFATDPEIEAAFRRFER